MRKIAIVFHVCLLLSIAMNLTACAPVNRLSHTSSLMTTYPPLGSGYIARFADNRPIEQKTNGQHLVTALGNMKVIIGSDTNPDVIDFLQKIFTEEGKRSNLFTIKRLARFAEYNLSGNITSLVVGQKNPSGKLVGRPAQYQDYIILISYQAVLRRNDVVIYSKDINISKIYHRNFNAKQTHESAEQVAAYWLDVALTQSVESLYYDMQKKLQIASTKPFFPKARYWP